MAINAGPKIVEDGLVFCVDAANKKSYPGAGTTWTDLTANKDNGTLTNMDATNFSNDSAGSLSFDGANELIQFNSTTMPSAYPFSLSAWIKTTTLTGGDFRTVAAFGNTSNNHQFAILGVDKNTSRARWTVRSGSSGLNALAIGGSAVNDGTPHFLVGVSASASDHRIYLDGVLIGTSTTSLTTPSYNTFNVGALQRSSTIQFFDGNIYLIHFYNRALSASEVLQNYNATKWRFQ